ncbi:MAG TPA: hypothetical protein VMF03_02265 [Steroidobacteraceae bacterium]|nr:hypothetical protein [Steroidobacteraceae bacterium]
MNKVELCLSFGGAALLMGCATQGQTQAQRMAQLQAERDIQLNTLFLDTSLRENVVGTTNGAGPAGR